MNERKHAWPHMTTRHTIETEIEVAWSLPGTDGERESAHPKVRITFDYKPGRRACFVRGGSFDPPDPPEVELVTATMLYADGLRADRAHEIALEWLGDDPGFDAACAFAEADKVDAESSDAD